ncbi:MAG: hypothetical protein IPH66_08870 [Crocinitomicaceae bacterium]|nr:hypothetical protein [Crocinitomicaceae bacterium]
MKQSLFKKYLLNCFLLTIPILIWNIVLTNKLPKDFQPEVFWNDIPNYLTYGENISRIMVFILTFLMPLNILTHTQKKGLILYLVGTIFYFASWIFLIYFPESWWSNHIIGFMAPAYTPILWLAGIGLIGNSYLFNLPFNRWIFFSVIIFFMAFHNYHALIVYLRTH